jgi:hypothetical protein
MPWDAQSLRPTYCTGASARPKQPRASHSSQTLPLSHRRMCSPYGDAGPQPNPARDIVWAFFLLPPPLAAFGGAHVQGRTQAPGRSPLGVGGLEVAFDAEDPGAGLPVETNLTAADEGPLGTVSAVAKANEAQWRKPNNVGRATPAFIPRPCHLPFATDAALAVGGRAPAW